MMDCFSPTFLRFFVGTQKLQKNENFNILLIGFTTFLSLRGFLSGIEMGVNIVFSLFLPGTHNWSFS